MLRKSTDEELETIINPFYDNYHGLCRRICNA